MIGMTEARRGRDTSPCPSTHMRIESRHEAGELLGFDFRALVLTCQESMYIIPLVFK